MGLHEGEKEVLVSANHIGYADFRRLDCSYAGIRDSTVHLYLILAKGRARGVWQRFALSTMISELIPNMN
jgi:hypothetical protein